METIDNFIGSIWPQNCGDSLKVLEKVYQKDRYHYKCEFQKYPFIKIVLKEDIIKGKIYNPEIERVEFIQKLWPQRCGDTLKIIRKTNQKNKSGQSLWECEFIKYPYKILTLKHSIINGQLTNPLIEQKEFIEKLWPQNCGDILKVIKKDSKRSNKLFFECEFVKYPYKVIVDKQVIQAGKVLNPLIEQKEFIEKLWPQKCGDTLRIIKKSDKKQNGSFLWECEFVDTPFKVFVLKDYILKGTVVNPLTSFQTKIWPQNCGDSLKITGKQKKDKFGKILWEAEFQKYPYKIFAWEITIKNGWVNNPQIEVEEFINKLWPQRCGDIIKIISKEKDGYFKCQFQNIFYETLALKDCIKQGIVVNYQKEFLELTQKIWPQNCGDSLKVLRKTSDKDKNKRCFLWECEFQKYPCKILSPKYQIVTKQVYNPNLPWRKKELLKQYIKENFVNQKPTLVELANSLGVSSSRVGNAINEFGLRNLIYYYPNIQEDSLRSYVESLILQECPAKSFKELGYKEIDIPILNWNLGIEYNGSYWHSEEYRDRLYHQQKTLEVKEKLGIDLIHIFEYEWNSFKQDILKSYIQAKLGLYQSKIGARQCEIREVPTKDYQEFCDTNHLQGQAGARVKLGLYYQGELVQVMSFGSPRFTDTFQWEIIRECSKAGWFILGGKEKLWKYFVQNYSPDSVISYCDFSKFSGNSYLKLGFKKERLNPPGFVWFDEQTEEVFWRSPEKHKEMQSKYIKIWDCGQLVFSWKGKH